MSLPNLVLAAGANGEPWWIAVVEAFIIINLVLVCFAYLTLAGTALAFVLWFNGIRRLPSAAPPLLGLAAPITGAVMGWIVLGQSLSSVQLVGFAITIGAIVYGATVASVPAAAAQPLSRNFASRRSAPVGRT